MEAVGGLTLNLLRDMSLRHKNVKESIRISECSLAFLGDVMNNVYECAAFYKNFINHKYTVTLANGKVFSFVFQSKNFFHLIGLEKLTDIPVLHKFDKSIVYKMILSNKITSKEIENSHHYYKIKDRVEHFETITEMLDPAKTNLIIDFDKKKVAKTKLHNTRYIFFLREMFGYNHLTIGFNGKHYPETFIFEQGKRYINEQTLVDIINIQID